MKETPVPAGERTVPSEREILDACQEIQQKWSETERRRRAGLPKVQFWLPPLIPIEQMGYDAPHEAELSQ
jgi:hypothetical protein